MRPLAPWLSSHLVRDAKVTKCTKILTHHRFFIFFGHKLSDQFRPEQKGFKCSLSETLDFKCARKYKMTLKLRFFMYFSFSPSRNKRYFCSSLSCWEDHLHAQLLFTAPGRPQDGRPKGERLQWIRLQTPAAGVGHHYYLPKPGVGSLIIYFFIYFFKNNINCNGCCFGHRDEDNFCATVPKDGRSYSPTLFCQTVRVLKKINKPGDMIVSFSLLADKIKVNLITMHIYLRHTPFSGSHGCFKCLW